MSNMFCTECGEVVQPGSKFCGGCGSEISVATLAPESVVKPAWLKVLLVVWAFVYSSVGTAILIILLGALLDWLGYDTFALGLANNGITICAIVGLGNALTRGVAAARRM